MLHLYRDISPYSGYFGPGVLRNDSNKTELYLFRTVVLIFFFQMTYNMLSLLKQA